MRGRTKKIDYHNKKYANPFFQKKRRIIIKVRRKAFSWRGKLILAEILVLVIGLVWFFCFSTVFSIQNLEVNGAVKIPREEINNLVSEQLQRRRFLAGSQGNLFLFSKEGLAKKINNHYILENLEIQKKLPSSLIVNIQEKSYAFIWSEADKYYYVDADGYIMNEINPLEIKGKKYPLINNQSDSRIIDIEISVDKKYVNYILDLFDRLNKQNDFEIEKFIIDKDVNTVKLAVVNGPQIYFNTNQDPEGQINKLMIIKNEKLKDDFLKKSYIDLRYGDRVYYR